MIFHKENTTSFETDCLNEVERDGFRSIEWKIKLYKLETTTDYTTIEENNWTMEKINNTTIPEFGKDLTSKI